MVAAPVRSSKPEKLATMESLQFHRGLTDWSCLRSLSTPYSRVPLHWTLRVLCLFPARLSIYFRLRRLSTGPSTMCRLLEACFCAPSPRDAFEPCPRRAAPLQWSQLVGRLHCLPLGQLTMCRLFEARFRAPLPGDAFVPRRWRPLLLHLLSSLPQTAIVKTLPACQRW